MKKLSVVFLVIFFCISSCKNKEGCTDPLALTYNADATKNDQGLCNYSTVTFYASGNSINNKEIAEIIVRLETENDPIGNITTFNQVEPASCPQVGYLTYHITSGTSHTWHAEYRFVNDSAAFSQGDFSPNNSIECINIDLLP